MTSGGLKTLAAVEAVIADVLYPIGDEERGVIVMLTSTLEMGYFGCVAVGSDLEDVHGIREKLSSLLDAEL